jgi:hypothetical protein
MASDYTYLSSPDCGENRARRLFFAECSSIRPLKYPEILLKKRVSTSYDLTRLIYPKTSSQFPGISGKLCLLISAAAK